MEIEPVIGPMVVGLKVTVNVQLPPGFTVVPQVLACVNDPVTTIFVMLRIPSPVELRSGVDQHDSGGTLADQISNYKGALTARQLAEFFSVSAITVFKMAKRGTLPCFRVGSCVRFCPRTVADWLRKRGG
jgi:excisionase family DNA binding protein